MKRAAALVLVLLLCIQCPGLAWAAPGKDKLSTREGANGIVCLTFDDGFTDRARLIKVLDILRDNHLKCTFFIIGNMLKRNPDLWRRAIAEGHEICYHTMTHSRAVMRNADSIMKDLDAWNKTASEVLGADYRAPMLVRLPFGYGQNNPRIAGVYVKAGYQVIGWNVDPLTGAIGKRAPGANNAQLRKKIIGYIRSRTKPNSIILLHFDYDDVNALPSYIQWLKSTYTLGKVSDAIATPLPEVPASPAPSPAFSTAFPYDWEYSSMPFLSPPMAEPQPFLSVSYNRFTTAGPGK